MLRRFERMMQVYAPSENYGEMGEFLGNFPISVSFRTAEEVEKGDVLFTNLRLSAYARTDHSPAGGYVRGMVIEGADGGERYHLLVPVKAGRLWILKLERVMCDGDGGAF